MTAVITTATGTTDLIVTSSKKMMLLDRLLPQLLQQKHRVVMFSQFTSMLDILEDYLTYKGYEFVRLDGSTNRVQRTLDLRVFNRPRSSIFIYLMSTRAGGLGLNCQTADTVILYDSDWNPQGRHIGGGGWWEVVVVGVEVLTYVVCFVVFVCLFSFVCFRLLFVFYH